LQFAGSFNYEAVLFFFLLSGFVITNSALRQGNSFSLKKYMKRRAGRILPIYWLSLLITGLVGLRVGDTLDFAGLLGNILFLQTPGFAVGWFEPWMGNGPLWSLSYEVFYYLIFGFLFSKCRGSRLGVFGFFVAMLLFWLSSCMVKVLFGFVAPQFEFGLLLPLWLLGCVLAFVLHGIIQKTVVSFVVAVFGLIGSIGFLSDSFLGYSYLIGALFYFVLDVCVRKKVGLIAALNTSRIVAVADKLGGGSYALYALHMPILVALKMGGVDFLPCCLVLILMVIVCPWLERSFHWRV
jgi:peptidoglycan/LPS O-acetylase OafA/YrhL